VGPMSSVEIVRIGNNRGNQIILLHVMWEKFIERHVNIEQLLQSPAPSSAIQNLIVELVKIHDVYLVKFKSCDACLYMKSSIVLFLN